MVPFEFHSGPFSLVIQVIEFILPEGPQTGGTVAESIALSTAGTYIGSHRIVLAGNRLERCCGFESRAVHHLAARPPQLAASFPRLAPIAPKGASTWMAVLAPFKWPVLSDLWSPLSQDHL